MRSISAAMLRVRTDGDALLFPALETLNLGANSIGDLLPLQLNTFPRLTTLFLEVSGAVITLPVIVRRHVTLLAQDNDLSGTAGLEHMLSLQRLVLDRNRVKSIDDLTLSTCPVLAFLYLRGNRLRDMRWALPAQSLQIVVVDRNKVSICILSVSLYMSRFRSSRISKISRAFPT
jgi:hypothetical protein